MVKKSLQFLNFIAFTYIWNKLKPMKNIRFVRFVIMAIAAFQITSCDVEPIDPAVLTDNPVSPVNPGENPDDNVPSEGDYWPTALNNTWRYSENGSEYDMKINSVNSIGGLTYYTFDNLFGMNEGAGLGATATGRIRKAGGNYYFRMEDIVVSDMGAGFGMTVSGHEAIILKDNVAVGQTWETTFDQTTSFTSPIIPNVITHHVKTGKILEKGISINVRGVAYNDVIKCLVTENVTGENVDPENTATTYWFAKGVGPVKIQMVDSEENINTELVRYTLN